jgi:NAD(P)-dependent dehydrogenase (short-subunit alcohol dehydrogenase family)
MIAKALEANGATVYIIGRRLETLQTAASQSLHGKIIPLQGDVTSTSSLSEIVNKLEKEVGYINVLIANSGISGPVFHNLPPNPSLKEYRDHLLKFSAEDIAQTFEVNTTGVFLCVVQFLELLDAGNRKGNVEMKSQVIATSSIGGLHRMPIQGSYAYSASKAGTTHMVITFPPF